MSRGLARAAAALAALAAFSAPSALAAGPAAAADDWQLLTENSFGNTFHADELPKHPAPDALALVVVGGLWNLVPTKVALHVEPQQAAGVTEVSVQGTVRDAMAFLRLPGLVAGKVDTPDVRFKGVEHELAKTLPLPFKGAPWRLEVKARRLYLSDGAHGQKIGDASQSADGKPDEMHTVKLLWAGDLDRDGKLDLLISDWYDDGGQLCLYRSGDAAPGELVGKPVCLAHAA